MGIASPEEPLSEQQCWALLATASVGRIALSVHALPAIVPVQYYLDGRQLTVCLGPHLIPRRSLHGSVVAFEADAIDPASNTGWAVQILGRSRTPLEHGVISDCGHPGTGQLVGIDAETISGHAVHLCPLIDALRGTGAAFPTS
jgi:pyridoxamine 5'-phosphate oxidase-like protein